MSELQILRNTRGWGRWVPGVAVAVFLAACAPALREVPQPVAPPARLSEAADVAAAEPLPDRWWLVFEDPALDDLVERALAGNFSLRAAWDRLAQAEAVARKAGAERFPSLDGEAGASRTQSRSETGDRRRTDASNSYSLGLATSYEADLWGRVRSSQEAAELDRQASAEDLQAAAVSLSAQVATVWYDLLEQHGQIALLDQQLATNEQILELITLRFRRGQVGAADVLQQRQLVESSRGDRAVLEARTAVLGHELAVLSGAVPEEPPPQVSAGRDAALVEPPPLPATGLPADLLRRRPDVRSAFLRVAAADRRVAAAVADQYPRVSLAARVTTSGDEVGDLFRNWFATLAGNLLAPLFDGGRRQAEVERTRAAAAEALNRYGQTVLEALAEVEDALVRERRQRERIASLDQQLALARLVVERVRERYLNGAEEYLRVLAALLSEQQLQRTRLSADRELIQLRIALCRALAGGWDLERPPLALSPTGGQRLARLQ